MTSRHDGASHLAPRILVCYDGTPGAARALQSAATLFPGQPAVILYVRPRLDTDRIHTTPGRTVRAELIDEVRVADRREADAVAGKGVALAVRAGLKARPLTVQSTHSTADTILRAARDESVAVVVIGRTARTRLGPFLLGSVTRGVVDNCPTPVLVA